MTTTERLMIDLASLIAWVWHLLPWWAWAAIAWAVLSVIVALQLGPALRRNRQRQFGDDD